MPERFPERDAHVFNCVRGDRVPTYVSLVEIVNPISGGYSGGVPPLPIPNREVKPARADGTAMQCGRVGSRLLYGAPEDRDVPRGLFFRFVKSVHYARLHLFCANWFGRLCHYA